MRTWLVLAAVLAVAAAAVADALHGGLRDKSVRKSGSAAERRIVPPGVPAGFMGTVIYSDLGDDCRLHSLRLAGFTEAQPPNFHDCRFSLSPDGTRAAPEGSAWSPLGGLVAVPTEEGFALEAGPGQTIVVRGHAPAFKPDGTLTQMRDGHLVEWTIDCRAGERLFTLPSDNATARCVRTVFPHPVTSVAWFSDSRFVAVLPRGKLVIVEDGGRVLVHAKLPRFRSASLELSPQRTFATLWLDGELAGTFDSGGGPAAIAPVGEVTSLAWAPSERWVLAATKSGAVFLLRPDAGDPRVRRLGIAARDLAWR